jgi:hypothetical protein
MRNCVTGDSRICITRSFVRICCENGIKEDEMGEVSITHECDEKILVGKSERKRNNLEDLGVDGRTVLKWIIREHSVFAIQ